MDTIRRISQAFMIAASFAMLAACAAGAQQDPRTVKAAQEDIGQLHAAYLKAFNSMDPKALAATYTDDAIFMPPNEPPVKTSIAIETYAREKLVPPLSGLLLNAAETEVAGDWAYSYGYYSLLGANGAVIDRGKFLEVIKHTDAGWKLHRDIYNSDNPAQPAAATAAPAAATR